MRKEILAVCDTDLAYAEHLTDYLNRNAAFRMRAVPFTETDALKRYRERERVTGILIAEELCEALWPDGGVRAVGPLSGASGPDGGARGAGDLGGAPGTDGTPEEDGARIVLLTQTQGEGGICRYQSCEALMRCIEDAFPLSGGGRGGGPVPAGTGAGNAGEKGLPCRLIGVYSPLGRCGKTSFAVTLAMILSETMPALYVNLENFSGFQRFAVQNGQRTLSDLIYAQRMRRTGSGEEDAVMQDGTAGMQQGTVLNGCVTRWAGLDSLNPSPTACDLGDIEPEEWEPLFELLAGEGGYRAIVLDIGDQIREVTSLLARCERIYMPVLTDRISQGKTDQFERNLELLGMGHLTDRIRKVAVPRLRNDGELAQFPEQLVRGRIGSYVRHVCQREEGPAEAVR